MNEYPQAIIFDMDGLLVDTEPLWQQSEATMLVTRGHDWNVEIQRDLIGRRLDEFLAGVIEGYGLVGDTVPAMREELICHMEVCIPAQAVTRPGAVELIAYTAERNLPRAIASSSPHRVIDAVMGSQRWADVFPLRVSGDDVNRGKPAPDIYLEAAHRLGLAPETCLALEDSPNGARAAVAAGMTCFAVPDLSHTTSEAFSSITPHVFPSLFDVLAHLRSLEPERTP